MYGGSVCAVAHYCFGVEPFGRPCRRSTAVAEWRDPGPPPGFRATLRYQVTRVGINSQRYSRSVNCSRGASPRCNQLQWTALAVELAGAVHVRISPLHAPRRLEELAGRTGIAVGLRVERELRAAERPVLALGLAPPGRPSLSSFRIQIPFRAARPRSAFSPPAPCCEFPLP